MTKYHEKNIIIDVYCYPVIILAWVSHSKETLKLNWSAQQHTSPPIYQAIGHEQCLCPLCTEFSWLSPPPPPPPPPIDGLKTLSLIDGINWPQLFLFEASTPPQFQLLFLLVFCNRFQVSPRFTELLLLSPPATPFL